MSTKDNSESIFINVISSSNTIVIVDLEIVDGFKKVCLLGGKYRSSTAIRNF